MPQGPPSIFARDRSTGQLRELPAEGAGSLAMAQGEMPIPRYHVLLADDDEGDRTLLLWHLGRAMPRDLDMMVECTEDGGEAIEKCISHSYSLVLMDWEMPRVSGDRLLLLIHERLPHTAVVVVSGLMRERISLDLTLFGATFLNKNELNATRLRAAIEASMNLRNRRTQSRSGLDLIQESQRG